MKSLRSWQITFVIGSLTLLIGAVSVWGVGSVAAGIGLFGVVVTVLSQLLSNPRPGANALSTAKEMLNVPPLLKGSTILVWLATFGILSYWVFVGYQAYRDRHKVNLDGVVVIADGKPAHNATVSISLKNGYLQTISEDGRFSFAKVDLSEQETAQLTIHARLGSQEGEADVDLSREVPRNIVIKLSPGDSPFRISYFLLEHRAIDFFLQGKMDKQWEARLAGQPYIVPNVVSAALSGLVKDFSRETGPETSTYGFYRVQKGVTTDGEPVSASEHTIDRYFVGSSDSTVVDVEGAIPTLLNSLITDPQWKVYLTRTHPKLPQSLVFRRFANESDLSSLSNDDLARFYAQITKQGMPENFGYLELYIADADAEACGDSPVSVQAQFVGRTVKLRVAVVENITNQPIRIGKFAFRENAASTIYTVAENGARLRKYELQREVLFPLEILKPGEKIAIPIEMQLDFDAEEPMDSVVVSSNRHDVYDILQTKEQWYFGAGDRGRRTKDGITLPTDALTAMLSRSTEIIALQKVYVFGPSVMIEKVEVDGVEFPFRQFDPARIVVLDDTDVGSCPYVYTKSAEHQKWHNEGVILKGRVGLTRESLDEKALRSFNGELLIREQDPEDSFIDSIFVKVIYRDGKQIVIYPKNRLLNSVDGKRIKMRQGDELFLSFDIPEPGNVEKYILGAIGYYVPYE